MGALRAPKLDTEGSIWHNVVPAAGMSQATTQKGFERHDG